MAVQSRTNQYRGVNAHLQSHYQSHGGWTGFQGHYVGKLAESINSRLPRDYIVDIGQSFQRHEPGFDDEFPRYNAVKIYKPVEGEILGKLVTRIEVLTPYSKIGSEADTYHAQRLAELKQGIRLIEVDYLHETPSPIKHMPHYPEDPQACPYNIIISDPTPSLQEGNVYVYPFYIDEHIPIIHVPLEYPNTFLLDFGEVYDEVFRSLRAYGLRVDYERLPEHFGTYSAADQARIRRRMRAVIKAHEQWLNLDEGPFPLDDNS